MSRSFHPGELAGAEGGDPTTTELAEALATAREIEAQLGATDVHPSAGFVDRVMGAVATEARPQPAIAAGMAVRRGRLGAAAAALADSWRVAFTGGRPLAVRAQAAAFVLVVILALGSIGGFAAVGAVRLLQPAPTTAAPASGLLPTATPTPTPTPSGPSGPAAPTSTTEPDGSETPGATEEPTGTEDPTATPGSTRRETPEPRETREPRETPEPTETPEPGDGSGGSGSGDN